MAVLRSFLRSCVFLTFLPWSTDAVIPAMRNLEAKSYGLSTNLPTSPDCWLNAVKALDHLNVEDSSGGGTDGDAAACNWMTPNHQKVLALELTRCHLKDLGRSLMTVENPGCSSESLPENLAACLPNLTDAGFDTYTNFFTYVNQLCTRLMQEVVISHYYQTSIQLAKTSELAEERLQRIVKQQEELWNVWTERGEELSALQENFRNQVVQHSIHMKDQALELHGELQKKQEKWLQEQRSLQREQAKELELQQEELQRLSETVVKTHQSIKPWSHGLDSMLAHVIAGYTVLKGVFSFLAASCVIWFFTLPGRFRWMRRYMICLVFLEILVELLFVGDTDVILSGEEKHDFCVVLRGLLICAEALFYFIGVCTSICGRYSDPSDTRSDVHLGTENELRILLDRKEGELLRRVEEYEQRLLESHNLSRQKDPQPTATQTLPTNQRTPQQRPHHVPMASSERLAATMPCSTSLKQMNSGSEDLAAPTILGQGHATVPPPFGSHGPSWNVSSVPPIHVPWGSMRSLPWVSPPPALQFSPTAFSYAVPPPGGTARGMLDQHYFGPGSPYAPYPKESIDTFPFDDEGSDDETEEDDRCEEDDSCPKKRPASFITPMEDDTDEESDEPFAKRPRKDLVSYKEE